MLQVTPPHTHTQSLLSPPGSLTNRAGLAHQLIGGAGGGISRAVRVTIDQLLRVNVFINEAGSLLKRGPRHGVHVQEGAASG